MDWQDDRFQIDGCCANAMMLGLPCPLQGGTLRQKFTATNGWSQNLNRALIDSGLRRLNVVVTNFGIGTKMTRRQKTIARDFPFVVKTPVPPSGLGKRLNAMHAFHHDRGIQLAVLPHQHDTGGNYLLWCFASPPIAEEFAAEFSAPSLDNHLPFVSGISPTM